MKRVNRLAMMAMLVLAGCVRADKALTAEKGTESINEPEWFTNFEAAKKIAAEKKLPILIDFSGSDWCGWCIKLEKEVFSKDSFKKYASDNLVLFLADFPNKKEQSKELKEQNSALATKYGIKGFPTVLLLDDEGRYLPEQDIAEAGPMSISNT